VQFAAVAAVEYIPAPQSVHTADPVDAVYLPATHAVHGPPVGPENPVLQMLQLTLPAGEEEFDGQAMHAEAPTAVEYVPVPQSVHAADPVDALYLPATHTVHGPPVGPENPVLQMLQLALPAGEEEFDGQAMHAEAPTAVEYVPSPQAVQLADPVDVLYLPATHAAHGPPFGPIAPALQVQLVKAPLPAGELDPAGQALHVEFAEAPTAVEYVPPPQFVHAADPVDILYLPATHAVHGKKETPAKYVFNFAEASAKTESGRCVFQT
jgi:hypothetical protein